MYIDYEERAVTLGRYIADSKATVRKAAKKFGVSKSTVHTDITVRLRRIDPDLFCEVRKVLDVNKQERHIRGGIATREKYKREVVR
jgi:putative DeoR family transcriptional regulator (stage III sporulation protein D)